MKLSKVFRNAAIYLERAKAPNFNRTKGVCWAIDQLKAPENIKQKASGMFQDLYMPLSRDASVYYMARPEGLVGAGFLSCQEAKARRVLALLFAAEVAKSEGL